MNIKSLLVSILLIAGSLFGQGGNYPLVTLHDINYIPDSTTGWPNSPLAGDTVRVQGLLLVRPIVGPVGDRRTILYAGAAYSAYIQSEDGSPWGGLNIYQADSTAQGTFFDLSDTASVYEFTGVVVPYGQATELALLTAPVPVPVNLITTYPQRPAPIRLTMDSCFNADGTFNVKLRKYLGMYVEMVADASHNLITSDLITGTGSTAGGYHINDGNGRFIQMYAQSRYWKTGTLTIRPAGTYTAPQNGSYLKGLRGLLQAYNNVWEIVPMYPNDVYGILQSPPAISNCKRDPGVVTPGTAVTVKATVVGLMGGIVTKVQLFKTENAVLDSIVMTKGVGPDSTTYTCTIPGISSDSAFVDYYIKATDNNNLFSTSPQNITNSRYSYFVLNPATHPFTIQHVRYSPFGSGYSSYNGYPVTVTGVVTSDTSSIPGSGANNPPRVFIQNGTGPWSAIILGYKGAVGMNVFNLVKGDLVTVTGIPVQSSSSGTRLDTLSVLTVLSQSNPLPEPHVLATGTVGMSPLGNLNVEPWNGCIVKYEKVLIDSANADGNYNYGESFVKDSTGGTHTRVSWSDGRTRFFAGPTAVSVTKGDYFASITGILGYTHSNYKLCPRNDDDIVGYSVDVKSDENTAPLAYKLHQNYPNPFNPSTIIAYDLVKSGMVTVKIYNVLGQQVKTLVSQVQSAGTHQVSFNASSLNSGVYFYSLTVDNFTSVKKMMLIK